MSRFTFDWSDDPEDPAEPSIAGEFVVGDTLGEGGMGVVHLAEQRSLERTVAVKRPRPGVPADHWARLRREAKVTGWLEHPGIVPVHALGVGPEGEPLVVMKRIEGVRWTDWIESPANHADQLGDDPLEAHVQVLADVCQALEYAHARGVLHLDVKPDNVMIGSFGEVYLLDWGLAVATEASAPAPDATRVTRPLGTPAYAAPEQARGQGSALSPRTDVFGLGAALHHALTGQVLYEGHELAEVLEQARRCEPVRYGSDVDAELGRIASWALSRDPADRPASAAELRRHLVRARSRRLARNLVRAADEACRGFAEAGDGVDEIALARLASQARFGYRQALEQAPDLDEARQGLTTLAAARIRRAIDHGDADSARDALVDLPVPDPELHAEVERLVARRAREAAELEERRQASDLTRGAKTRGAMMVAVGASVFCPSTATEVFIGLGWLPSGYWPAWLGVAMVFGIWLVTVGWHARFADRANDVTRNLEQITGLSALQMALFFAVCQWLGLPVHVAMGLSFLLGGALLSGVAAYFDRRFGMPVAVYAVGGVAILLSPWTWATTGLFGGIAYALIGSIALVQREEARAAAEEGQSRPPYSGENTNG